MTTVFSWMLDKHDSQVRFVLADDVLIRMEHTWDTEWMVRAVSSYHDCEIARDKALAHTALFEEGGFTLSGSVCTVTTDIQSRDLYVENLHNAALGPSLWSLFALTWTDLP